MRRILCILFITSWMTSSAYANWITSWGDGQQGTDFIILQDPGTITILRGNGNDYAFYAETSQGSGELGVINNITVDTGATGDFTLLIDHPDAGEAGAMHWKAGDLTYGGGTSIVLGIDLAGNICANDENHDNIFCDVINGDINVGGSLAARVGGGAPTLRMLKANSITGNITLGEMVGDIETGSLDGDVTVGDTWGGYTPGDFRIGSGYAGTMHLNDPDGYNGSIHVEGDFTGNITVEWRMAGNVEIDGDMIAPCRIWFKWFMTRINGSEPPNIHVHGSIIGSTTGDPVIEVGTYEYEGGLNLEGTIAIDGSLTNAVTNGHEIVTRELDYDARSAIVVDYDGWDPNDVWDPNATVLEYRPPSLSNPFERVYNGNSPDYFVYEVTFCIGDVDNNETLDSDDLTAMGYAILYPGDDEFVNRYPGLEGSLHFHADIDCDGDYDDRDESALEWWLDNDACCLSECQYRACRADFDKDGEVDLGDLAELLGTYDKCPGDEGYNPDCNIYENDPPDGCIYLNDLAELLGVYSDPCDCFGDRGAGAGEGGGTGQAVSVSVEPYDTDGYTAKGFAGECDHFVFDLTIELDDADDDWTTSGVVVTAENGATFRLAATPTASDPYASFVSTPRVADADADSIDSGASLIGAYLPPDADYEFDSSVINISWFDLVESHDGPAGVMRLVIDVSGVADADTTGGLGSVYFSQTGPASVGDIKLADFSSATSTRTDAAAMSTHNGAFFVKTE